MGKKTLEDLDKDKPEEIVAELKSRGPIDLDQPEPKSEEPSEEKPEAEHPEGQGPAPVKGEEQPTKEPAKAEEANEEARSKFKIRLRNGEEREYDLADVERLTHQAEEAAHVLGASVHRLTFPDNRFDAVPLLDLCRAVETWLAEVAPHEVYTHHPGCLNVDHRLTAEAVLVATRPIDRAAPRLVASFEVPSATEWAFATTVRPNLFVEVTETLETKIQAMRCYAEEMRPFPHPRSPEMLRALAQRWGAVIGVPAAEAFTILREIR